MKKRRYDSQSAQAEGLGYLLRRLDRLDSGPQISTTGPATNRVGGDALDVSVVVAASDALSSIKAAADFVCDGTADQVEIEAAIDMASNNAGSGSGKVVLSEGNFYLSDYVSIGIGVGAYVDLVGAGSDHTFVQSSAAAPSARPGLIYADGYWGRISDMSIAVYHDNYEYAVDASSSSVQPTMVERCSLVMSVDGTNTYGAIYARRYITVRDCEIYSTNDCLALGVGTNQILDNYFTFASTQGNGSSMGIKTGGSVSWRNNIQGNYFQNCPFPISVLNAHDNKIVNNFMQDGPLVVGNSSDRNLVVGNYIYAEDNHGIQIEGYRNHIALNFVRMDATLASTYDGIHVTGTAADYNTIVSNQLYSDVDFGLGGRYAINIADSGAQNNVVRLNEITGGWSSSISDSGTSTETTIPDTDLPIDIDTETFFIEGTVTTGTGQSRLYAPVAKEIIDCRISLSAGTATVDANKDGTTIFTTQPNRPAISSGNVSSLAVPDVTSVAADSYITVDVDAASSAEDLVFMLRWRNA